MTIIEEKRIYFDFKFESYLQYIKLIFYFFFHTYFLNFEPFIRMKHVGINTFRITHIHKNNYNFTYNISMYSILVFSVIYVLKYKNI